jgi:hypothetical protein
LERISWLCRDHRNKNEGNGQVEIIFSNRSIMSYEELRAYLRLLKEQRDQDVRIDWNVVDPKYVSAVNHEQLAGLQVADAVASSLFYAVHPSRYGEIEEKYAALLSPTFYRHKNNALGYGIKFWPADLETLKKTNPHLSAFADGGVL